jgi:hypothetical protein
MTIEFFIRRPVCFENGAHSVPVERQMQSVILCEPRDLSFSINLGWRLDALQFFLRNRAVMGDSVSVFNLRLICSARISIAY